MTLLGEFNQMPEGEEKQKVEEAIRDALVEVSGEVMVEQLLSEAARTMIWLRDIVHCGHDSTRVTPDKCKWPACQRVQQWLEKVNRR
jgi:hypothetical protein